MHPVQLDVDYVERRSRLTTFFRWLLVIPHVIFLAIYVAVGGFLIGSALGLKQPAGILPGGFFAGMPMLMHPRIASWSFERRISTAA